MVKLDIEDFRSFENEKTKEIQNNKEELSLEELERFYKEKIKQLEEEYKKLVEEEKKKAFDEGCKKGKEEAKTLYEKELQRNIEKVLQEKENKFKEYLKSSQISIKNFLENVKEEYVKHLDFIEELILSALEEILQYMYINPSNYEFLAKEIKRIVMQLKNSSNVRLMISPSLYDYLKDLEIENLEIEIDESLSEGDFIIEFDHVQLESNFKDKVKILKDEIKREIKKHTKI